MIEATQDKLAEAHFFLGKLVQEKEERQQPVRTERKEFWYYVSAFLSAARSVLWVLQSEERERYDAWHATWDDRLTEADHELLKLTTEQRNAAVKRGVVKMTAVSEKVPLRDSEHPIYGLHIFAPPATPPPWPPWTVRDVHYFEVDGRKDEVIATCEAYFELLTKIVADFIAAHSA